MSDDEFEYVYSDDEAGGGRGEGAPPNRRGRQAGAC